MSAQFLHGGGYFRFMKHKWIATCWIFLCIFWPAARKIYALVESAGPDGCNTAVLHGLGITGQGVSIGIISQEHCRISHEAFFDKDNDGNPIGTSHAHWLDPTGDTVSPYEPYWHDTIMAGIAGSRGGKLYPNDLGMAPDAEIYSAKITQKASATDPNRLFYPSWIQDAIETLHNNNCRIVVTGIQLPVSYDDIYPFTLLYDYYADAYDVIFANAAGNDSSSITIFGTVYNGMTTGGLITTEPDVYRRIGSRSNPGPTTDDRKKPDLCAPAQHLWVPTVGSDTAWRYEGYNGETSWAGPHIAGIAALLISYADSTPEPDDGRGEVIKAVMVNSAFPNILDEYGTSTTGQVWNRYRGYGRIDALRAFDILSRQKIVPGIPVDPSQAAGWTLQPLPPGQTQTYLFNDLPFNNRLVVTLAWKRRVTWNDKPPRNGSIDHGELTGYLADLDLQIYDPNGVLLFPGISAIDNLEKADLLLSTAGPYQIQVINKSASESADYALAFELLQPISADFNVDYIVNTDDLSMLTDSWLGDPCPAAGPDCGRVDLITDGTITLADFADFTRSWFLLDDRYYPYP